MTRKKPSKTESVPKVSAETPRRGADSKRHKGSIPKKRTDDDDVSIERDRIENQPKRKNWAGTDSTRFMRSSRAEPAPDSPPPVKRSNQHTTGNDDGDDFYKDADGNDLEADITFEQPSKPQQPKKTSYYDAIDSSSSSDSSSSIALAIVTRLREVAGDGSFG